VSNTWTQIAKLYTESSIKQLDHSKRNTNKDWIQQDIPFAIIKTRENKKNCCRSSLHDSLRDTRITVWRKHGDGGNRKKKTRGEMERTLPPSTKQTIT
jgi:hypothetical protein